MIDLAAIRARMPRWGQCDHVAMIAEIERLRAEVELLRTGRDVTRAHADRLEAEALVLRGEREAVVTWLQAASQRWAVDDPLNEAADAIERGDHRREGAE